MFDIFKEFKKYYFDEADETLIEFFGILKIIPENVENVSSNDIVIDESSFLEALEEEYIERKNLFKNLGEVLKVEINISGLKINDNANIIFTSSKKIDLPDEIKSKNIFIQFNANFNSKDFNFIWDVKQSKHNKNVFYEFSTLKFVNKIEFKSDCFDCIKKDSNSYFSIHFKWNKEYKSDKFRNTFINFIEGITKNSPDAHFDFNFYIEDYDILQNTCDSGIYEFYLMLSSKIRKSFDFLYSFKNKNEKEKLEKLYKDKDIIECPDKEIEIKNEKQMNFETRNIFYKISSKIKLKSLKFKNIDNFKLTFKQGLECENLIIENVKKFDFKFNVNNNKNERINPQNLIMKNSKIDELYLDEKFIDKLYLLSVFNSYEENVKLYRIIFENITVKDLYIHSAILPFINNNFEKIKDRINTEFKNIPIDVVFKNIKAKNLNIFFSLGDNPIVLIPIQDFYEFKMISKNDFPIEKYFKNKNTFFEYLLTGTKDSFLFSELKKLANNSIKSENIRFAIKNSLEEIIFLDKKQNEFLELVSRNPKEFLSFKKIKDFLI